MQCQMVQPPQLHGTGWPFFRLPQSHLLASEGIGCRRAKTARGPRSATSHVAACPGALPSQKPAVQTVRVPVASATISGFTRVRAELSLAGAITRCRRPVGRRSGAKGGATRQQKQSSRSSVRLPPPRLQTPLTTLWRGARSRRTRLNAPYLQTWGCPEYCAGSARYSRPRRLGQRRGAWPPARQDAAAPKGRRHNCSFASLGDGTFDHGHSLQRHAASATDDGSAGTWGLFAAVAIHREV